MLAMYAVMHVHTQPHKLTTNRLADRNGDVRMLEVLLGQGAKSIPEFVHYHTPLHLAALYGHLPAALALIAAQGAASVQV
jgi:ankyrin repeat protein